MASSKMSNGTAKPDVNISVLNKKGEILPQAAIKELKAFKSELVIKGEASEEVYRAAIHRWNEAYIEESSIVAFCESEDDIRFCLHFVQKWGMDLAISGGRHNYHGASTTTGFVIDNRKMKKVVIDKEAMTVTAQSGCKAKDVEDPLSELGLAIVMGIVADTGIAGITLGGGSGPLTGKHGHVVDSLLSAKLVLADGTSVLASEDSNPDLFWAIRGGGSNFGVASEFTFRVYKQDPVYFAPLIFAPNHNDAIIALIPALLRVVEEHNGKLAIFAGFTQFPPMTAVHPAVFIIYDGPEEEAKALVAPLFELGPAVNLGKVQPYVGVTNFFTDGPPTHQRYSVGSFLMPPPLDTSIYTSLLADFIAFMEKYGPAVAPSKILIELRTSSSKPVSSTALGGRTRAPLTFAEAQYDNTVSDTVMRQEISAMIGKCRDTINKQYDNKSGAVLVPANISDGAARLDKLFGENLPRLRELKKKYDPNFVFDKWYPIDPNAS